MVGVEKEVVQATYWATMHNYAASAGRRHNEGPGTRLCGGSSLLTAAAHAR